jgi:hypothetical protein
MIDIKSELSKILGKIEELERFSQLDCDHLYPLIEEAYLLISDYFEIDQCHSIIHQLANQMRELKESGNQKGETGSPSIQTLRRAQTTSAEELRIFISHL